MNRSDRLTAFLLAAAVVWMIAALGWKAGYDRYRHRRATETPCIEWSTDGD